MLRGEPRPTTRNAASRSTPLLLGVAAFASVLIPVALLLSRGADCGSHVASPSDADAAALTSLLAQARSNDKQLQDVMAGTQPPCPLPVAFAAAASRCLLQLAACCAVFTDANTAAQLRALLAQEPAEVLPQRPQRASALPSTISAGALQPSLLSTPVARGAARMPWLRLGIMSHGRKDDPDYLLRVLYSIFEDMPTAAHDPIRSAVD
eukprot:7390017-Prymnesium_polylepis.1